MLRVGAPITADVRLLAVMPPSHATPVASRRYFFLDSAESAVAASVRSVPVSSARTASRVTVAFFTTVRISAVTISVFLPAAFLFDSETALSVFRVSTVAKV